MMKCFKDTTALSKYLFLLKKKDARLYSIALIILTYGLSMTEIMKIKDTDFNSSGTLKNAEYESLVLFLPECKEASKSLIVNSGSGFIFSKDGDRAGCRSNYITKFTNISKELGFDLTPAALLRTYGFLYLSNNGTLIGSSFSSMAYRPKKIMESFDLSESEYAQIIKKNEEKSCLLLSTFKAIKKAEDSISSSNALESASAFSFLESLNSLLNSYTSGM